MKRKLVFSAFVLLILLFGYHQFGWFTPYNWFTAKWDLAKGAVKLVEYGELEPYFKEKGEVAERLGFRIENVGCNVYAPLVNGMNAYNREVERHLNEKLGIHWKREFHSLLHQAIEITDKKR